MCKKGIPLGGVYQACSVSTCKKHVYCSVSCWDSHVPVMNHKSAWAEERRAPKNLEIEGAPRRRRIVVNSIPSKDSIGGSIPKEILVVASKLKSYIKAKGNMNTSGNVLEALSDIIRQRADDAIYKAKRDGRKTVMNKDFF